MKNYMIIIISLLVLATILFGVYLYLKPKDIELSKNEKINTILSDDNKEKIVSSPIIDESLPVEEKQIDNSEIIDTSSTNEKKEIKSEPTSPSTTVKKDSSITNTNKSTQKNETIKKEPEIKKQENKPTSKVEPIPKPEPKQETPKENVKPEPPQKQEVVRCTTNDNHFMGVGNSGKWFSSKAEAIQYYEEKIVYWDNWWQNTNSPEDDATYYKNCPYGYEVWSCMYCSRWTINFYYR